MENKIIAKIKLNPGKGGYFDPISRIHLTHGNPFADVYAGTNTTGLKQAVYNKRISLLSGSLGVIEPPFKLVKGKDGRMVLVPNNKNGEKIEAKQAKEVKIEQPKVEEPKAEEVKVEEVVEEVKEEVIPEPVVEETPAEEPIVEETAEEVEEVSEESEEAKEEEESTDKKKKKKKSKK